MLPESVFAATLIWHFHFVFHRLHSVAACACTGLTPVHVSFSNVQDDIIDAGASGHHEKVDCMGSPHDRHFPLERQGSSMFPGPAELPQVESWPCSPTRSPLQTSLEGSPAQTAWDRPEPIARSTHTSQVKSAVCRTAGQGMFCQHTAEVLQPGLKVLAAFSRGDVHAKPAYVLSGKSGFEKMHCMLIASVPLLPPCHILKPCSGAVGCACASNCWHFNLPS